jgi:hypothetical protein
MIATKSKEKQQYGRDKHTQSLIHGTARSRDRRVDIFAVKIETKLYNIFLAFYVGKFALCDFIVFLLFEMIKIVQ